MVTLVGPVVVVVVGAAVVVPVVCSSVVVGEIVVVVHCSMVLVGSMTEVSASGGVNPLIGVHGVRAPQFLALWGPPTCGHHRIFKFRKFGQPNLQKSLKLLTPAVRF